MGARAWELHGPDAHWLFILHNLLYDVTEVEGWGPMSFSLLFVLDLSELFVVLCRRHERTVSVAAIASQLALDRFHLLQPHLEEGRPLRPLTIKAGISYRTAQRPKRRTKLAQFGSGARAQDLWNPD
jgi:hypothetical protein